MRERYPKFFDSLVWPAVILGDACLLLNAPTTSFLAITKFGAGYHHLALIAAAGSLTYVLGCPLMARVGARVGLRRMALAGMFLYVVWGVLLALSGSIWHLALCNAVAGLGGALVWPNLEAELAQGRAGPLLRRRLSIFNAMWCAGTVLGPFLGRFLYPSEAIAAGAGGREAINLAYYASAAVGLVALILLALWRPRLPGAEEVAAHRASEAAHDPAQLRAFLWMAYVANFMCYLILGVLRNLYEALARYQWAGREPEKICFGLLVLLAASGTVTFLAMFFMHRWSYRLKRHIFVQVLTAAALAVVALSGSVLWAVVGFLVIGACTSFIYSGSLFYSIEGRDESSHMAGWHEAVLGAGSGIGLLVSGFMPWALGALDVADSYWRMRSPYLVAVVVFMIGIVVQLVIYRRHRPQFAVNGNGRTAPGR